MISKNSVEYTFRLNKIPREIYCSKCWNSDKMEGFLDPLCYNCLGIGIQPIPFIEILGKDELVKGRR